MAGSVIKDIPFAPGVVKDETERGALNRWTDAEKSRWVHGVAEKLGGWTKFLATAFLGICRGQFAWRSNAGLKYLAIGTHIKLYVIAQSTLIDITPIRRTAALTNPFDTTSGSPNVTVNDTGHGAIAGAYVTFDSFSAVGGITLDGEYLLQTAGVNDYTITHSSNASSTVSGGGGTGNAEYQINPGQENTAEALGYGTGTYGSGTYGTPRTSGGVTTESRAWTFDNFGENLQACPRGGDLYEWKLDTTARALRVANSPQTNIGIWATDERHIAVFGADDNNLRIAWCDQENNTIWDAAFNNTAGARLVKGGAEIRAALRSGRANLVLTNSTIWEKYFVGAPNTFGYRPVDDNAGILGIHAAVEAGGAVYWMGVDNFHYYDGVVRDIKNAEHIQRFVYDGMNIAQREKIVAGRNSLFDEIWWLYPSKDSTEIDRYVIYNTKDKEWTVGSLARTAWVDRSIFDKPLAADADGFIYQHEDGVDDNTVALASSIISAPIDIADGDAAVEILGYLPDFKDLTGTIKVEILTRYYPHGPEETHLVGIVDASTERLSVRASGRQARMRFSTDDVGDNWRMGIVRLELKPAGRR